MSQYYDYARFNKIQLHHRKGFDEKEKIVNMQFRESTHSDNENMRSLLQKTKLPTESIGKGVTTFFVAERDNHVVGVAGFEFYGHDALLRSVAVPPDLQHHGLGSQVVDFMLKEARKRNLNSVVLLTETATDFFLKKGFNVVERSSIDNEGMKGSSEFAYACPKSAVCMKMLLK